MEDKLKEGLKVTEDAFQDIIADGKSDPWTIADKAGKPLETPMDNKTIKNAILKRIPEVKRIQLVASGMDGKFKIVCVCQLIHETAIIIEDDANIHMRHKDLMNIVDKLYNEIVDRKKMRKTNKLPADFFNSEKQVYLQNHT